MYDCVAHSASRSCFNLSRVPNCDLVVTPRMTKKIPTLNSAVQLLDLASHVSAYKLDCPTVIRDGDEDKKNEGAISYNLLAFMLLMWTGVQVPVQIP